MTSLLQDVRYGVRMLLKHKGFTAVAASTDSYFQRRKPAMP